MMWHTHLCPHISPVRLRMRSKHRPREGAGVGAVCRHRPEAVSTEAPDPVAKRSR
ncbi:MAG: hypothetical protein R2795_05015 [Saprospiraceae bacterium]